MVRMFRRLTARLPTLALALEVAGIGACGSVASKGPGNDGSAAGTGDSAGKSGVGGSGSAGQSGGGGVTGTGGSGSAGQSGAGGAGGAGGGAGIVLRGAIRPLSSAAVGSAVMLTKQSLSLPAATVCTSAICLTSSGVGP